MSEGRVDRLLMDRLLRPRSIAFYGGPRAEAALGRCLDLGYAGEVWPVHPLGLAGGREAFAATAALPAAPDLAVVDIPGEAGDSLVTELSSLGAGGILRFGSRAPVTAEGAVPVLQEGFVNALDGISLIDGVEALPRVDRGVGLLCQSGGVAAMLAAQKRGLPLALAASTREDLSALGAALTRDDRITAIGLVVESIEDVAAFEVFAIRARRAGIPVAAVARDGDDADLLLARLGIARLGSLTELVETLKLLHVHGVLAGRSVMAVCGSNGEAMLTENAGRRAGLTFPVLPAGSTASLGASLGEGAVLGNPLVLPPAALADREIVAPVLAGLLATGADLVLLGAGPAPAGERHEAVHAFRMGVAGTETKAAAVWPLPDALPEALAEDLAATGMAPLAGVDDAFAAIAAAAFIGEAFAREEPMALVRPGPVSGGIRVFPEAEGKYLLKRIGVAVPDGSTVGDATSAVWAAEAIGYPLVVKAVGAGEDAVGATSLSLGNAEELSAAITRMLALSPELLVERMVEEAAAELFVSIRRLPGFAFKLTMRLGGVLPELVGDAVSLLLPTTEADIRAALLSLKLAPSLAGHGHAPAADIDAAVAAIDRLASFSVANEETMLELTVDPLMLRASGQGAVAAGVLIRMAE